MSKRIDLKGQKFGDWVVERYLGKSTWRCRNTANNLVKDIHSYDLRTKYLSGKLGYKPKEYEDIKGQIFNSWKAIEYLGSGRWKCECLECGNEGTVSITDLRNGHSKRCNNPIHKNKEDLTGRTFGLWKVLEYAGDMRWKCQCQCENKTIKNVLTKYLVNGESKSCGCGRNYHVVRKDISGQTFNNLLVLGYTGADNLWKCKCLACGNEEFITHRDSIVTGKTKSCGCLKETLRKETLFERYGDTNTTRINNPRETWQIDIIESKDKIEDIISSNTNITVQELAEYLGVQDTSMIKTLKKFGITSIIKPHNGVSSGELYLRNFINTLSDKVEYNNRTILNGRELDIYLPDCKIAIEFNGNYWHSDIFKDKKYHQEKTLECAEKGIRLIHIFEYEWRNAESREKIQNILRDVICTKDKNIVYARDTLIRPIDVYIEKSFLNKYHIQGYAASTIKLGCFSKKDNKLLGIMTFGKNRFETESNYEIIRLCWISGTVVVGGAAKLFKNFIKEYNPESIMTYTDMSKFTGDIYKKLGFKYEGISEPGYVWFSNSENLVLSRYQTQKHKLIKHGLGNFGESEREIMENIGYMRIYNSGNMKFLWKHK